MQTKAGRSRRLSSGLRRRPAAAGPACRPTSPPRRGCASPSCPADHRARGTPTHPAAPGPGRAAEPEGSQGLRSVTLRRQRLAPATELAGAAAGRGARREAGSAAALPRPARGRSGLLPPPRCCPAARRGASRRPAAGHPAAGVGAARRHRGGPAGGAAGGGRALSGAALQSQRGLRREHGTARRDRAGPGRRGAARRDHGDRHRDQPQDPGEREAAGSLPLRPRQGLDAACGGRARPMAEAPGSLRPPLRRRGGGAAAGPAPPSPLPPAEGSGGVKPQPGLLGAPAGGRPSASGLPGEGHERESRCFGKRSRGPAVPRRAGAISAPELEF